MKVTRNDVARLAGVSPAVVSYVLNNSGYVSVEKRQAVLEAARELHYSPNRFARGLRTNRSFFIALIGDSLQTELFESLAVCLFNRDYYSSLFYSRFNDHFIQLIIDGSFDAVFMTSNGFSAQQLNRIVESGTPVLLYKSRDYEDLSPQIVSMAPDFYDGVMQGMQYLIRKGHSCIGYVPPLRYRTTGLNGSDYRVKAYTEALRVNGILGDPGLVCTRTEDLNTVLRSVRDMFIHRAPGDRPTALLVGDDDLAAHILHMLQGMGLRVPQDVAIIGWGNIPIAHITNPQLTTVDSRVADFAASIADALIELAGGRQPAERTFPVYLVSRESA